MKIICTGITRYEAKSYTPAIVIEMPFLKTNRWNVGNAPN